LGSFIKEKKNQREVKVADNNIRWALIKRSITGCHKFIFSIVVKKYLISSNFPDWKVLIERVMPE
jgi:hypothetical protein